MDSKFDLQVNNKAFQINMDQQIYGTFAEIGAGQEVARRFFHVGAAAGTIAKTISAYDMTFSDSIYGHCGRYVSRQRLDTMLTHEFDLLIERLDKTMGEKKTFFTFSNTVAARSFRRCDECHGWLGIRFQTHPRGPLNDIILHVRMLDPENLQQQEALGIIGVNLIYGAFYLNHRPEALITSLMDDLTPERIEVDMIRYSGPAFAAVDNRIMALQLVSQGLTKAALFRSSGEVINPADAFYKKPILVERGSFRPITYVANDMLDCARTLFLQEPSLAGQEPEVLMEITMQNLLTSGELNLEDFLDRVDMLSALDRTVLISNFGEYYRLINYLTHYTDRLVGLPMGLPALSEIFEEKYYANLEGGILEGLGRLFKTGVILYIYPTLQPDKTPRTLKDFEVAPNLRHLFDHLVENRFIRPIENYNAKHMGIRSADILEKIHQGDPAWETLLPPEVANIIKERALFGYTAPSA